MKLLLSIALLSCSIAVGQQTIFKKDGSKMAVADLNVVTPKKQITFKANGKEGLVKFADVDSVVIDRKVLKRFDIGKKSKLYYILAKAGNRTLGVISSKRNRDRGGFSSVVTLYDVVVIENGKVLKQIGFTESKTEAEANRREEFFKLISDFFPECTPLRNKVDLFRSENDPTNIMFLKILDEPEKIDCK
ncbi:hypothetical protein [Flavobacterium selenitireducens]|uniref:hypothetical protein n=1 Tax=Flavobacterium selenitireducens TaxID=2722704 RepID=UPI00168B8DFC|nr:hypothetical protein [Flavobacterium selenitireducens]MBD3583755.1 hypothetical protein [Flavobacterium selenitireducens]